MWITITIWTRHYLMNHDTVPPATDNCKFCQNILSIAKRSPEVPIWMLNISCRYGSGKPNLIHGLVKIMQKLKKNDLSWCTEWEVQGMEPTTDFEFTPQDRKSPNLLHNEEEVHKEQVWVQVPTTISRQNFDIGSNIGLKTSSSFDSAHFLVMVGGLSTRLPFMSSLEVYWEPFWLQPTPFCNFFLRK